jgi:hypothetical protein
MLPALGHRRPGLPALCRHLHGRVSATAKDHDFSKLSDAELSRRLDFILDTGQGPTEYLGRPCVHASA